MQHVSTVTSFITSIWQQFLSGLSSNWFVGCIFAFPVVRYLFKKFLKSFR